MVRWKFFYNASNNMQAWHNLSSKKLSGKKNQEPQTVCILFDLVVLLLNLPQEIFLIGNQALCSQMLMTSLFNKDTCKQFWEINCREIERYPLKMEYYTTIKMFSWCENTSLSQCYVKWDTKLYVQYDDFNNLKMFLSSKC